MKFLWGLLLGGALFGTLPVWGVQLVTESSKMDCEEFQFAKDLKIYRDPALFLSKMRLLTLDASAGWEALQAEKPVLTTLKGKTHLVRLSPPQPFKNFRAYSEMFELAEPGVSFRPKTREGFPDRNPMIVPVKICGNEGYSDALGFMLESDFEAAQVDDTELDQLPPSTPANGIPKFPRSEVAGR